MIRVGIVGYGNVGRGAEAAVLQSEDMVLTGVFTRRSPESVRTLGEKTPVFSVSRLLESGADADVLLLCGGSATDLPAQTPELARRYCVVDTFDTHARIPEHFARVDAAAKEGGTAAIISTGWDPGLFSLMRLLGTAVLPEGAGDTFWGPGVSQGHSDAVRRIKGVADARQYTIPVQKTVNAVRKGESGFTARDKHTREVYVVLKEGADPQWVAQEIITMPYYFDEYDTTVHFISADEMAAEHSAMPHGGFVIRSGKLGEERQYSTLMEFRLELNSNPMFTGAVMAAFGRACYRLHKQGKAGCFTAFDVPLGLLSPLSAQDLRSKLL
jgi:diaminopimelate dehydrogenase